MIKKDILAMIAVLSSEGTEDAITWAWVIYKSDNPERILTPRAKEIYKNLVRDLKGVTND